MEALGGDLLQIEQRAVQRLPIVGERQPEIESRVEARQHDLVLGPQLLPDEGPELAQDPVPIERRQVVVVDVDGHMQRLLCRYRRRRPAKPVRFPRVPRWRRYERLGLDVAAAADEQLVVPKFHGVEVADPNRSAVDPEAEIVGPETEHGFPVRARDVDVDVHDLDVDDLRKARTGRRGRGVRLRRRGRRQRRPDGNARCRERQPWVVARKQRGAVRRCHGERLTRLPRMRAGRPVDRRFAPELPRPGEQLQFFSLRPPAQSLAEQGVSGALIVHRP